MSKFDPAPAPIRCTYCRYPASTMFDSACGYHPVCNTCYPKAVKDVGSDADSFALDGSHIFKGFPGPEHFRIGT